MAVKLKDSTLSFQLESLEQRFMLAGDVGVDVSGGSLEIDGDGEGNIVVVTQFNNSYAVVGIDTGVEDADFSTSVFGIDIDIKLLDGVTKNVEANLRGGDDVFLINGSIDGVDLEDIFDSDISLGAAQVGRDLIITTAAGRDFVGVLNTDVGRDLRINTGSGVEDVVVVGGAGAITAALNFSSELFDDVIGSAGELLSEIDFWAGDLFGGFDGGDLETIGEVVGTLLGGVSTGRDLRIVGGSANDYVYVGGVEAGRDAVVETALGNDEIYFGVGANVQLYVDDVFDDDFGGPRGGGSSFFDLGELGITGVNYVGRNAVFNTSLGEDSVMIGGGESYEFVIGNDIPVLNRGISGFNATAIMDGGAHIGRELRINTGVDGDYVGIATNPIDSFPHGGFFEGEDSSQFDVFVERDLKIDTQENDDTVEIGSSDFFGEPFFGDTLGGQLLKVGRNASIDTGNGEDDLLIGQRNIFSDLNELPRGVDGPYQIEIGRDLDVNTGTRDDYVEVSSSGFGGTLSVARDLVFDLDGGNDILLLGAGNVETGQFESGFFNGIFVGDDLDIDSGNKDDQVVINYTQVTDDANVQTSFGDDQVSIQFSNIGDRSNINTGAGNDNVDIRFTDFGDDSRIRTDFGDDSVSIFQTSFGGKLDLETSRGNDWVEMRYSSANEELEIDMRDGDDTLDLFGVSAEELDVETGDGEDSVCAFDGSFDNGAEFNMGSDFDRISQDFGAEVRNEEAAADCDVFPT